MKKIIKTIVNPGDNGLIVSLGILFLRVVVGAFMLTHGIGKLKMLIGPGEIQFADPIGMGVEFSLFLTVFAEFFCSILLIMGLATRLATIPLMTTMLVAVFIIHGADPFGVKEMALLYGSIYSAILIIGPGKFSADHWIYNKIKS